MATWKVQPHGLGNIAKRRTARISFAVVAIGHAVVCSIRLGSVDAVGKGYVVISIFAADTAPICKGGNCRCEKTMSNHEG